MPPSGPVDVKGTVNYGALKDRNVIVTAVLPDWVKILYICLLIMEQIS
jgi:hypothetical protein